MCYRLPWRDIVMPAVDLAKNGFNVSKELGSLFDFSK